MKKAQVLAVFYLSFVVLSGIALAQPKSAVDMSDGQPINVAKVREMKAAAESFMSGGQVSAVSLTVRIGGKDRKFKLEPHDIRAEGYRATMSSDRGAVEDKSKVLLFKDDSAGEDFLRLAMIESPDGSEVMRGFLHEGGVYYSLNSDSTGKEDFMVMNQLEHEEVQGLLRECGVEASVARAAESLDFAAVTTGNTGVLRELEIATEADFEYVSSLSSSASANAEILAILNSVDAIYQSQLGITVSVAFQNTWTVSNDPYTSSDATTLLNQFLNFWNSNFSNNNFDVATLFTGRELNGSTAGIAFLDAACSRFSYGLVQQFSRGLAVPVTAHEIGHNLGADHDVCGSNDNYLMCPSLRGSANTFSARSINQIDNFINSVGCLSPVDDGDNGGGSGVDGGGSGTPPAPPVIASIGDRSIGEGSNLSFTISVSDPDSSTVTLRASSLPQGATLSNGRFSWTPGFGTVDGVSSSVFTVSFTATDSTGLRDTETVIITVRNINRAPVFSNPSIPQLRVGQMSNITVRATDPDGDSVSYTASLPLGASINSQTGVISWRPSSNQAGSFSITVVARDEFGSADTLQINFAVLPGEVSNPPDTPNNLTAGDIDGDDRAELLLHRASSGQGISAQATGSDVQFFDLASASEVPLMGDFNGDNFSDLARYNPADGRWRIQFSNTGATTVLNLGGGTVLPFTGDFDGDQRDDVGVFDPLQGVHSYLSSETGDVVSEDLGQRGDIPVPCDYDGDGRDDLAVFNPASGTWSSLRANGSVQEVQLGLFEDIPAPGDFNGDGSCQRAVWRPASGNWFIDGQDPVQFGLGGDIPMVFDSDGDGRDERVVYRPASGNWFFEDSGVVQFGLSFDVPIYTSSLYYNLRNTNRSSWDDLASNRTVASIFSSVLGTIGDVGPSGTSFAPFGAPFGSEVVSGDYDGDGVQDDALFQGGVWTLNMSSGQVDVRFWGQPGDLPVSGDFDGDGVTDLAVWRPADGGWYVIRSRNGAFSFYSWGLSGDIPVAADFNGDGWTDPAVWRPSSGTWFVMDARSALPVQTVQWGLAGDIPRIADFDRDGRADMSVWRPSSGTWFVLNSAGGTDSAQWGLQGDLPVPGRFVSPSFTDYAVYRPTDGNVYVLSKEGAVRIFNSGIVGGELVQTVGRN